MDKDGEYSIDEISGLALASCDLSVERALGLIDESVRHNYAAMYSWFMAGVDEPAGSRLFGERIQGVDADFAHCAQRGIHVPAKQRYAASITVSAKSKYAQTGLDGFKLDLDDGTWLLFYEEHSVDRSSCFDTRWMNQGLINCLRDGVPVGVFVPQDKGSGYSRSLAFVESFNEGTFVLHGPITEANAVAFAAPGYELDYAHTFLPKSDELLVDTREFRLTRTAARKGQKRFRAELLSSYDGKCAVCGGSSVPTLQGAHIVEHRGESANLVQNGLLLRSDIHLLYDSLNLSIEPETYKIVLSDALLATEYADLLAEGCKKKMRLPSDRRYWPNDEYLNVHHQRFLAKQAAA